MNGKVPIFAGSSLMYLAIFSHSDAGKYFK
mgnify:CR=1 FL=1